MVEERPEDAGDPYLRRRAEVMARARPITEPPRVRDVVEKFRRKYGADQVRKYYSKLDVAVEVPLQTSARHR